MYDEPLAYFITFRTYGTWLHGDERGSVDKGHNEFGRPMLPTDEEWVREEEGRLKIAPVALSGEQRQVVDATIREVCVHKQWQLLALNVRTNHVHCVVSAKESPESVLNALKAWSTRRMVEAGIWTRRERPWSLHGSTVYLFKADDLAAKCRYVSECQ